MNNLIYEYQKYALYMYNFQLHINRCYKDNIIDCTTRIKYINHLNNSLNELNLIYNKYLITNKNINNNFTYKIDKYIFGKNIFKKVNTMLTNNIGKYLGFYKLKDAINLILCSLKKGYYIKQVKKYDNFKLYSKVFIPLKYTINYDNKIINKINIFFTKAKNSIFEETINMHICINSIEILLEGYINNDNLGIILKTSQICLPYLYNKYDLLEKHIENSKINNIFAKKYSENSSIVNLLCLNELEYGKLINEEYKKFTKLANFKFIDMLQKFMEDKDGEKGIFCVISIIKLLLMGSLENVRIASLLYDIIKESKKTNDIDIADVIYNKLSYIYQVKLNKTSINIQAEINNFNITQLQKIDYVKQLIISNVPDNIKQITLEKIKDMSGNDYYKQLMYVKTVLAYPWIKDNITNLNLDNVVTKLDSIVYGHKECKDTIKELVGKWISNPLSSGSAIGLVGPPGIGKTLIAKALGNALSLPLVQITLGGQNDGELLYGHGYTYASAQPGLIVKKMVEAGSARCIMYFDELDKTSKKMNSDEIQNILIHLIDPNTNKEFQDRFFQEFTFPLDQVLFVFSYNDSQKVNKVLLDRITEIKIKPYQNIEKVNIIKQFVIKEIEKSIGLDDAIFIGEKEIIYIIDNYTNEPGIRVLKQKIEKIFLKLNIDRIYKTGVFSMDIINQDKIIITTEMIHAYLGLQNMRIQYANDQDSIGIVNGLYATELGNGGILPIQIFNNYINDNNKKFTLKLTGLQKKIMKESVITAFTATINILDNKIRNEYIKKYPNGFHIHTPSAAIPKNGPSAGVAFALAFVSCILDKKIKSEYAVTGEIDLTGKISAIGGLDYKLMGAKRGGIKTVIVPKENEIDVNNMLYPILDDMFKIIYVTHIYQVFELCLHDFNKNDFCL